MKLAPEPVAFLAPLPFFTFALWLYVRRITQQTKYLPADFAARPSLVSVVLTLVLCVLYNPTALQVYECALRESRRSLVTSSATRMGHADLAPLATLMLLRRMLRRKRGRYRSSIVSTAAASYVPPSADAVASGVGVDAPSGRLDAPSGRVDAPSGKVDAPSGRVNAPSGRTVTLDSAITNSASVNATTRARRAPLWALTKAIRSASVLEGTRHSFQNPYVRPFFRPSNDRVRALFCVACFELVCLKFTFD